MKKIYEMIVAAANGNFRASSGTRRKLVICSVFLLAFLFAGTRAGAATVNVASLAGLQSAIDGAAAGDVIVLADGTYTDAALSIGTDSITVRSATPGGAYLNNAQYIDIDGNDITFSGFQFTNRVSTGGVIITVSGDRNLLTQLNFDGYSAQKYINLQGQYDEVSYCNFENKPVTAQIGNLIHIALTDGIPGYHKIRYNSFQNMLGAGGDNGNECIRIENGAQSTFVSRSVVEFNYFSNTGLGDSEVISVKCRENVLRYNTMTNNLKGNFCFRNGDNNIAYGNFFLNSGGIRVKEANNIYCYNNYFENCGDGDITAPVKYVYVSPNLKNINFIHNTIIGGTPIELDTGATNNTWANNIFKKTSGAIFTGSDSGITWAGNQYSGDLGIFPLSGMTSADPQLVSNSDGYYGLSASSPAIDTASASYPAILDITNVDDDPTLTMDISGQSRPVEAILKDVGCDEFGTNSTLNRPLSLSDVGPAYLGGPHVPPSVRLTAPADGAGFIAPASIVMTAEASSATSTITTVGFYSGTNLLGSDASSPYAYTWTNVAAGSYSLTARATDDREAVGTSAAASVQVVSIGVNTNSFTTAGSTTWICPPNVTSVVVECWGAGGAGGSAQRTSGSTSQYGGGGAGGAYAKYNFYAVVPGRTYYINVGAGQINNFLDNNTRVSGGDSWFSTVTNTPSTIIIAKGGAGGESAIGSTTTTGYGLGGTGTTNGSAGDVVLAGGSGASGALNRAGGGGSSAGTNSPGTAATSNAGATAPAGGGNGGTGPTTDQAVGGPGFVPGGGGSGARSSSIILKAGGRGGSGKVVLTFKPNVEPIVSLTAPATGANFIAPASITLTANATDVDGVVTTVGFYDGTTLLGSDTNAPYAYTWTNVLAGLYNLTAKATDNSGAVSISAQAAVTVGSARYPLTVTGGSGSGSYTNAQRVAIAADAPAFAMTFDQWTGDTQVVDNVTYTNALVTMSTNAVSLIATYKDAPYTLTVNSGGGDGSYTNAQTVTIMADAPASGTTFNKWTGSTQYLASVTASNTTVTMPATNIVVTATYTNAYALTVIDGSGDGSYINGALVAISAEAPVIGKAFAQWIGDTQYVNDVTNTNATVTMSTNVVTLIATYTDAYYPLTVTGGSGGGSYTNGTQVEISADAPAIGLAFNQWNGDAQTVASGTSATTTVTMPAQAVDLTAMYKTLPGRYALTVSNGVGSGFYTNGAQVTITATAPEGTAFAQWSGDTQYAAGVFSLSTIVTMPAQDVALTASCVDASNGVASVTWASSFIYYEPGFDPLLQPGFVAGTGKKTIAQLMYSPDDIKDSIQPNGAGAENDVVWDTITLTEGVDNEYCIFSASTVRAGTNGYVYALIFEDNHVQPGTLYVAGPLAALADGVADVNVCAEPGNGDAINGVNSAPVVGGIVLTVLTVNNGSGGGSYTNGHVQAIVADAPASGYAFDKWIGDTQVVNNVTYTNALVTLSTNPVVLTATYKNLPGTYPLTVNNGTGSGLYSNGVQVAITANAPAAGKTFSHWAGDTQVVNNVTYTSALVTMSTNAVTLTATYVDVLYALTVTSGSGDGSYTNGRQVAIAADAISGKAFDKWIGDTQYVASASSASTTATMPAQAIALTATYVDVYYALTVTSGTGGGGTHTNGTKVAIVASNAPAGQAFARWTGDSLYVASITASTTTVTMPAQAVSLTATYKTVYTLTVNSGDGSGSYTNLQKIVIVANNAPGGQAFARWIGDTQYLSGVTFKNPTVTMPTQAVAVTATYTNLPDYYTLTVTNGTGGGSYTNEQQVTVTAVAPQGTAFSHWTGDTQYLASVSSESTTVTMPAQAIALTATCTNLPDWYTLTVNNGSGTGLYTNEAQVAIAANAPASGKIFSHWTGDTQVVNNVTYTNALVTMSTNTVILTATYQDITYGLTVTDGTGSGSYTNRAKVSIVASNAPTGQAFDRWIGNTNALSSNTVSTTVTMPASNIAVAATYKNVYMLTVTGGTGSGSLYTNMQVVAITASNAPSGMIFVRWIGDTNALSSNTVSTTVTMPATNVAVTATYTNAYALTVTGGTGGGLYIEGAPVTITATLPVGMEFDRWTGATQYVAGVTFSPTTVTMPAANIAVAATYKTAYYAFTVINGTGSGSYTNGQRVAIAATIPKGLTFVNWNDGNTNASRTVTTPPAPVTYTANIIDMQKPTVKITFPAKSQKVMTNGMVVIRGTAADNVGLTNVMVQLYTGEWTNAVTANGWKNWTANFYPVSGLNTARVYSVDIQGNVSATSKVVFTYVPGAVMQVQLNGDGTIKPDYNGQMLEIGKSYTMTAKAVKNVSVFTDWTYGIGGPVASDNPKITFVMQSNLVLTANFHSLSERVAPANIAVAAPATAQAAIVVDGSAKDWANVPRSSFSYASVTQEVAVALDGNNIALLLNGCPFKTSDNILVYFKLRLSYGDADNRHSVDLWTSGSVLYGMVDGQVITGLEAVLLNGVLEVKLPVEQAPSQVTIEEIGCGMDLGGGALTELFKLTPPPASIQ